MKLPSHSVRIARVALAYVENAVAPVIINGKCECCGGKEQPCSPPFVAHTKDCAALNLWMQVRDLILGGIEDAKAYRKAKRRKKK